MADTIESTTPASNARTFIPRSNIVMSNFDGDRGRFDGNALAYVRQMRDWFTTLEDAGETLSDLRKINEFGIRLVGPAKLWFYSIKSLNPELDYRMLLRKFELRYHPEDYDDKIMQIMRTKKQGRRRTREYTEDMALLYEKFSDPAAYTIETIRCLRDNCQPIISYELHKVANIYTDPYELIKFMNDLDENLFRSGAFGFRAERPGHQPFRRSGDGDMAMDMNNLYTPQKKSPPKGKCFRCGKTGHWKRECPEGPSRQ